MNRKIKKILSSLVFSLISVLVLVGSVFSVYADNVDTIHINGGVLKRALDGAARVQVIANTMKRCLSDINTGNNYGLLFGDDVRDGEIFGKHETMVGDSSLTGLDISVGSWLEKMITGEFSDGVIWCTEPKNKGKIAKLFAEEVLGSGDKYLYGMICDSKGEGGGMLKAYSRDGETEYDCANAFAYRKKSDDEIEAYVKTLYENRRAEVGNEYWAAWDALGDYTETRGKAVGYWMYRNDFESFCESNDKRTQIDNVSLDYEGGTYGKIEDEEVRVRSNWESKTEKTIIGNKLSCKDLQGKLEDFSDSYKELSLDYLGDQCKEQLSPVIEDKLAEYRTILGSDNNYDEETLQKMRDYMNEWGNYKSLGGRKFIEKTDKGGYKCNSAAGAIIDFNVEPPMEDPTDPGSGSIEPNCVNSGGAMSLGWIVCPILDLLGNASEKTYTNYVEPRLNIPPKLFSQKDDEGTKKAWATFQTIANVIFIILFLVVIFSQLTGVGIDNYGIKKILPKLIMVAILVNLSYYICLICVDLSNILGNGFKSLFDGLSTGTPTLTIPDSDIVGKEFASTGLTAVALLLALVMMVGAVWKNPAILLSLLVAALGVTISIFFMFILLATREAAVVVLVVGSPIAFVCYALPNMKRIVFDKWVKMLEGMLLLYPICGLLIGGGNYVSRLLLSSGFGEGGFIDAFTAMIVGIVPIFFVPTLLKGSFAAFGNLGARISGVGERLRGGVTRGIRNTEGYRNAQRMGLERRTRLKAGLDENGNLTRKGERKARRAQSGLGKFFGADKRQAAFIAAAKKNISTGEEAGASLTAALASTGIPNAAALPGSGAGGELGDTFGQGREGAYYGRAFLDAARRGDITAMNAAIEAMRSSNMKAKDIAKIVRYASNHNFLDNIDNNTRATWQRDMAKKYGGDFLSTDFELSTWMRTGGAGMLGNYGAYAASERRNGTLGMDDIRPEDISKMSGDSLAGMAMAGLIDQSMAQRVLATSPNLAADKKIMLGALANGATVTSVDAFKTEAKNLMNANSAAFGAGMTIGGLRVTEDMRNAWTSSTPQEVNVVQNFQGGGQQYQPVAQEAGMYEDSRGNVYTIRRTRDGRHVDDGGFEVDISRLHPR